MSLTDRILWAFKGLKDGLTGEYTSARVDPRGIRSAIPTAWGWQNWLSGTGYNPPSPQARLDYYRLAGDLSTNSVVAICLAWIRDNFPQGRLRVGSEVDGEFVPIEDHPLASLFRSRPNPVWTWRQLWGATSDAYKVDGNAYWIKARDDSGLVRELYWVPNDWIRIHTDDSGYIDSYIYTPGRTAMAASQSIGIKYDPVDVIHFRDGIDPRNPAVGISRLKRVIRNVAGYNAGETYTAAILRNSGISGVVLIPKESLGAIPEDSPDEAAMSAARRRIRAQSVGESAGDVVALSLPVDVGKMGESPESMMLDRIMDRPEAIICAAMGVNALVTGLPASDASRTYSNLGEANRMAWENSIIPMQQMIAETLQDGLSWEFDLPEGAIIRFDNSKVESLSENADARAARAESLFTSTLYPRGKALQSCGFDPLGTPDDDLYYGDQTEVSRAAAVESVAAQQEVMAATADDSGEEAAASDDEQDGDEPKRGAATGPESKTSEKGAAA